jgi:hypothetical protein
VERRKAWNLPLGKNRILEPHILVRMNTLSRLCWLEASDSYEGKIWSAKSLKK